MPSDIPLRRWAATSTYNLAKLQELAQQLQLPEFNLKPALERLTSFDVPDFATAEDNQQADIVLSRRSKPLIRTKKRLESQTYKIVAEVLPDIVEKDGNTGLAQAFIRKAPNPEVVENVKQRQTMVKQRDALLESAVNSDNVALVWLLASTCSQPGRNHALRTAIRRNNKKVILKLLQYRADPSQCEQEFLEACRRGDHALVSLLLRGSNRVDPTTLMDALAAAVKSGSLHLLTLLTQATDLSEVQNLEAVNEAVRAARIDMLVRLLLVARSLDAQMLDELVGISFKIYVSDADLRLRIMDALFFAGAAGKVSAACFAEAVARELMDFIQLFAKHHVDINWDRGKAAVTAAQTGRSVLLKAVLDSGGLSPDNASRAMNSLPQHVPSNERQTINKMLLSTGAHGSAVDHELVLAIKRNDEQSVGLMLEWNASLDRNEGGALIEAIKLEQVELLRLLLKSPVRNESLIKAFPYLRDTRKAVRLAMTKLLLKAGASGEAVDAALRDAVCDRSGDRDVMLIDALIQGEADPAFNDAQTIQHAIATHDVKLFGDLMGNAPQLSQGLVSSLVDDIMNLDDHNIRHHMLQEAIKGDATVSSISKALVSELSRSKPDIKVIDMLVNRGSADTDYEGGKALMLAVVRSETDSMILILSSPNISLQTITNSLQTMLSSRGLEDSHKALRAQLLLAKKPSEVVANVGFSTYVEFCKKAFVRGRDWPLETFEKLLCFKADPNMDNGTTFMSIVDSGAIHLMTAMLASAPLRQDITNRALLRCVSLLHSNDRSDALGRVLACRPTINGASLALIEAVQREAIDEARVLLQYGALPNFQGNTPIREAVSTGNINLLTLFLGNNLTQESLAAAFEVALRLTNPKLRLESMESILRTGLRGEIIDQHLINLVHAQVTPVEEVRMLLDNEASVRAQGSRSLILAATLRKSVVLQLLFTKVIFADTATLCFQACLAAGLIESHDVHIMEYLLKRGVLQVLKDKARS
ncbi:hypothetical protein A1O3_10029 [Capronia epimyces CBS 606.96]|uniref:Uncharacterized protein n=1 Tax=Capronia epimyces CBS 606.96 TaxID=1182542 RepID=W9XKC2_9EURO|nr:uncharacterized protein A1O3_10029 [Capronia epimyces CBS 606.96]EXJ77800.1 hypothetical protein A1O3_10029 [Capronia epimyces CBS 606.96]